MNRIPRASFAISMLRDSDPVLLASSSEGREALGVFMLVCLAGRERLQAGRAARRDSHDGDTALVFLERPLLVARAACITLEILDATIAKIAEVCKECDGSPWLFYDDAGRLVVRSFFKFNAPGDWGGSRPGAGRKPLVAEAPPVAPVEKPKRNQVEKLETPKNIQVESSLILSPIPNPIPDKTRPAAVTNHWEAHQAFADALGTTNWKYRGPIIACREVFAQMSAEESAKATTLAKTLAAMAAKTTKQVMDHLPKLVNMLAVEKWHLMTTEEIAERLSDTEAGIYPRTLLATSRPTASAKVEAPLTSAVDWFVAEWPKLAPEEQEAVIVAGKGRDRKGNLPTLRQLAKDGRMADALWQHLDQKKRGAK